MIEWGYAIAFAGALGIGWAASFHWGGYTERATMCLLSCIWLGVMTAQAATQQVAPFTFFATLDMAGIFWLWQHQRRNWQWVTGGLFAAMLACHAAYWAGIGIEAHDYLNSIAALAYLQIGSVIWAARARRDVRNGKGGIASHWALANNWLPRRRLDHKRNAGI